MGRFAKLIQAAFVREQANISQYQEYFRAAHDLQRLEDKFGTASSKFYLSRGHEPNPTLKSKVVVGGMGFNASLMAAALAHLGAEVTCFHLNEKHRVEFNTSWRHLSRLSKYGVLTDADLEFVKDGSFENNTLRVYAETGSKIYPIEGFELAVSYGRLLTTLKGKILEHGRSHGNKNTLLAGYSFDGYQVASNGRKFVLLKGRDGSKQVIETDAFIASMGDTCELTTWANRHRKKLFFNTIGVRFDSDVGSDIGEVIATLEDAIEGAQSMYAWFPRKGHAIYIFTLTEEPADFLEWSNQVGGSFERYKDKKFGKDKDFDPINITPLYGHIKIYADTGNEVLSPADGCFLWNLRSPLSGCGFDTAAQNYWPVALQLIEIVNSGSAYASRMDRLNQVKLDLRNRAGRRLHGLFIELLMMRENHQCDDVNKNLGVVMEGISGLPDHARRNMIELTPNIADVAWLCIELCKTRNKPLRKLLAQKNGLSRLRREMVKIGLETLWAELVDLYRPRDKVRLNRRNMNS